MIVLCIINTSLEYYKKGPRWCLPTEVETGSTFWSLQSMSRCTLSFMDLHQHEHSKLPDLMSHSGPRYVNYQSTSSYFILLQS